MTEEKILTGGRSTPYVIKSGNIVYRPHKHESDFANNFLIFLEKQNYPYSQRFLGTEQSGRDKYLYIYGSVPNEIGDTTLEQLYRFIQMVKMFHDLSLSITNNNKVICHNDLSPCNTVFVNNIPIAIIDWDSCAVGERWEDITYILWLWINIGSHKRNEIDIMGQMKTALSWYGEFDSITYNFADKLLWRMNKVVSDMSPDNYQYARTKDWVEYSKLWVEENSYLIKKEIG